MSARLTLALCATAALIGLTGGTRTSFAQSDQPAAAAGGPGLEEVVVTARRREEKAQTVPITLLTFSPKALEKQDIRDALKLTDSIPGFNGSTGASLGLTYTFLRGAPGVIFYWDDVPINVNNQAQGFYFDMQNLQVLYGPQGTLFGLSNDAGAILFRPNHPKNDYDGYAKITLGDYGRQTVEALVNVPVINDKLLVRAGVQYQKQDGYQHVIKQNIDLLNQNYWNFRFAATYNATDNIRNDFMLNYFDTQYLPGAFTYANANPAGLVTFGGLSLQQILSLAQSTGGAAILPLAHQQLQGQNIDLTALQKQQEALGKYNLAALAFTPTAVLKQLNIVNTTVWDITDNVTLKNIAGFANIYNYVRADIGGLGFGLLQGPIPGGALDQPRGDAKQYNEELQIQGNFFDSKLKFQAGFFNQWGGQPTGAGGGLPSNTTAPYGINYTNDFGGISVTGSRVNLQSRTNALYTQSTYDLSDYVEGLSFTGGFRYTWDKFYTQSTSYSYVPGKVNPADGHFKVAPVKCILPGTQKVAPDNYPCPTSQAARFTSPSYTVQVNYQWRPSTMFYFNNSLGYKTGGFNGQNLVAFQIFKPEHLNNYETGVKTDFDLAAIGLPSVKSRFDGSLYYGVYRGIEIQTTGAYLQPGSSTPSLGTPFLDVGDGNIYGWDIQWTLLPWDDLVLQLNAEYNKGKYKHFMGPNEAGTGQQYVPGVGFEILPEYKFDGHATYHFPFINKEYGDVSFTGSYSWVKSSLNSDVAGATWADYIPGHHNVDISLDWNNIWGREGISGQFFVTNVTNNSTINGCLCAYRAIGELGFQPAQPRMFGFSLKYEFQEDAAGPAPAEPYTPPPPQAVAPAPRSYLVFFDFNKSDLTSQAEQIVDQAASNAGPAKVTRLTVTGHTDTVGSDAYNMRLSRRRAESVAARLEKDGIPSSEIEIVAKGKRDLLVPTADGVREPQNRRVQIVYDGGPNS
jgi:iron complex outermembrane receptor protein